ncbi:MAG: NAD+ synthase, partial [Desulfobulbaceae bacterium]
MKIALVQTNPIIGDFAGNCKKILDYANQAATLSCELAVFPELAVSGYPPLDLLERQSFIDDHQCALERLIGELPDIHVLLGILEARPESVGKKLYNSAIMIKSGSIQHTSRKKLLPSYDVFDESRYFEPGTSTTPYTLDGLHFGITICEDIWNYTVGTYQQDPVTELIEVARKQGTPLDYLVNISASPYHRGKNVIRNELFSSICDVSNLPLIYVNQVGGQDSLIFDGQSRVIDANAQVLSRAHSFAEDLIIYDTKTGAGDIRTLSEDSEIAALHEALILGLRDYVRKSGFRSVVLGLSGGIDSALSAALAVQALGKENVFGVALPSPYSSTGSVEDARSLAKNLGCRFEILPISGLFESFQHSLEP